MEWLTWLELVVFPSLGALYIMITKHKADVDEKIRDITKNVADVSIEVARNYVPNTKLEHFEKRITEQLNRIEDKIEAIRSHHE